MGVCAGGRGLCMGRLEATLNQQLLLALNEVSGGGGNRGVEGGVWWG
jgi:hypothetical protein